MFGKLFFKHKTTSHEIYSLSSLFAVCCVVSCNQPASPEATNKMDSAATFDLSSVKSTINEIDKKYGDAVTRGDSNALANLYATTAHILPASQPAIESYEGIKRFCSDFAKMGIKEFKVESVDVYGNGDNIIEEGKYKMAGEKGKNVDEGKYIVVYRKENGEWKIYRDIYNSNSPLSK